MRDDTRWYPTMRLFRQEHEGDWQSVFQRVAVALAEFVTRRPPLQVLEIPLSLDQAMKLHGEQRCADAEQECRRILGLHPVQLQRRRHADGSAEI